MANAKCTLGLTAVWQDSCAAARICYLHQGSGHLDHSLIGLNAVFPVSRALPACQVAISGSAHVDELDIAPAVFVFDIVLRFLRRVCLRLRA